MQKFESDSNPNLKQLTYKNQTTVDPSIIGKETLRFSQGVTLDSRLHKREEEKQSLTKAKSSVNRRKQRQSIRQAVKISMPAKQASVINTSKKSSSKKTNAYMIDEAPTITRYESRSSFSSVDAITKKGTKNNRQLTKGLDSMLLAE